MSTRSTITIWKVKNGKKEVMINLYRHLDGGLWGAGVDISKLIKKFKKQFYKEPEIAVNYFIGKNQNNISYEYTESPKAYSDRQFHYDIYIIIGFKDNYIKAEALEFPIGSKKGQIVAGNHFRADVAKELLKIRKNLKRAA